MEQAQIEKRLLMTFRNYLSGSVHLPEHIASKSPGEKNNYAMTL
jgi:hypothetical protein